jgi:hypothetical protein
MKIIKLSLFLALLVLAPGAMAIDLVTATVTVTNTAGTTNGQTLTVNANVRTWTNSVVIPGSQILTNATIGGAATNLFNQVANNPFTGLSFARSGTNGITLQTAPGGALSVSLSAGWGTVSLSTNTLTNAVVVSIPTSNQSAQEQTNINSGLVAAISDASNTNAIPATAYAVSNLVNLSTAQTVTGVKTFSGTGGLNGNVGNLTNGSFLNPVTLNLTNTGLAISSQGAASFSEQFGTGAQALGIGSIAVGQNATSSVFSINGAAIGNLAYADQTGDLAVGTLARATGNSSTAIGYGAQATEISASAFGQAAVSAYQFSTAVGSGASADRVHQLKLGTSSEDVDIPGPLTPRSGVSNLWTRVGSTNTFPAGSDIALGRYALTSLANGNNAAIVAGTNVFVQVSGPTGAFAINGIAGGRDGKFLILLNRTGQNMTIAHDSGVDPTAANRIYTMTGADRATTGDGAALLIYSAADSRWILLNLDL